MYIFQKFRLPAYLVNTNRGKPVVIVTAGNFLKINRGYGRLLRLPIKKCDLKDVLSRYLCLLIYKVAI